MELLAWSLVVLSPIRSTRLPTHSWYSFVHSQYSSAHSQYLSAHSQYSYHICRSFITDHLLRSQKQIYENLKKKTLFTKINIPKNGPCLTFYSMAFTGLLTLRTCKNEGTAMNLSFTKWQKKNGLWNEIKKNDGKRKKHIDGKLYSQLLSLTYRYGNFFISYGESHDN